MVTAWIICGRCLIMLFRLLYATLRMQLAWGKRLAYMMEKYMARPLLNAVTIMYRGMTYPPPFEYFSELKRVSRNQIIWGANHFIENVPNANSSCWIVWDKDNGENDFADCELAWTSFNSAVRKFKWRWAGMLQEDMKNKQKRIHPTEKPIALYAWLLNNYAKDGDTILDTHGGSGSICIAAHDLGFETTWIELDKQYYEAAKKRLIEHQKQLRLF